MFEKVIRLTRRELVTLRQILSTPRRKAIEEFYREVGDSKMKLETTISFIELWHELLNHKHFESHLADMESLILEKAIYEWGQGTTVIFQKEKKKVIVKNTKKKRYVSFKVIGNSA